jgi:hypothetical protein
MSVQFDDRSGNTEILEHDLAGCDATDDAFVVSCSCGWISQPSGRSDAMSAWKTHIVDEQ